MKKRISILVILLMSVGFAAIATNLFINGQTKISANQDDFNVYYSDAYINGKQDLSVITEDTIKIEKRLFKILLIFIRHTPILFKYKII